MKSVEQHGILTDGPMEKARDRGEITDRSQ